MPIESPAVGATEVLLDADAGVDAAVGGWFTVAGVQWRYVIGGAITLLGYFLFKSMYLAVVPKQRGVPKVSSISALRRANQPPPVPVSTPALRKLILPCDATKLVPLTDKVGHWERTLSKRVICGAWT